MDPTRRRAIGLALASLVPGGLHPPLAVGQDAAVVLAEEVKPGDCFNYEIGLSVAGTMKVDRGGKVEPMTLTAKARHRFAERVEVAADNGAGMAVRHYADAVSESVVGVDKARRELAADRRLIVAQRGAEGTLHYSPDGPLTRDELDLVAEHFDTLCLPGLLPNKAVRPGDTWKVGGDAAQAACLFHGLLKNELTGKLIGVKDGTAEFAVDGTAEGIEHGATVRVAVAARGRFDLAAKRVVALAWAQTDGRDQGPVSPALEVKAEVTVTRTPLAAEPKELDTAARAKVPADGKVPDRLTQLRYDDPGKRFAFAYPRDWHFVVRNDSHLVLRLLVRGECVAQVTVTEWKKPQPGADFSAAAKAFKEATANQPGWEPDKVLDEGAVPSAAGRRVYRLVAGGKQDGQAVVQSFHLVLGPNGEHLAATTLARLEVADKVGTRDVALISAIEFPGKK
jgi:hypothetical protein